MVIPKWFLRELKLIDPKLYVKYNKHYNYYEIWKDLEVVVTDEHGVDQKTTDSYLRAVFQLLNDDALANLRYRQWLGRNVMRGKAERYVKWLKDEERKEKAKAHEFALDMMTEGFMRQHRHETSKMFT